MSDKMQQGSELNWIAETGNSGCTYFHTKMIEYFI